MIRNAAKRRVIINSPADIKWITKRNLPSEFNPIEKEGSRLKASNVFGVETKKN